MGALVQLGSDFHFSSFLIFHIFQFFFLCASLWAAASRTPSSSTALTSRQCIVTCKRPWGRLQHMSSLADHVLVPAKWSSCVIDVKAERMAALQSHHVPVSVDSDISIPKRESRRCEGVFLHSLADDAVWHRYCETFAQALRYHSAEGADVDEAPTRIASAMHEAISKLPQRRATKQRPWISSETVGLIDRLNLAWQSNQRDLGALSKRVKASAKRDSQAYLDNMLKSGDWQAIRSVQRGNQPKQGRLRDLSEKRMSTERRAETLAECPMEDEVCQRGARATKQIGCRTSDRCRSFYRWRFTGGPQTPQGRKISRR